VRLKRDRFESSLVPLCWDNYLDMIGQHKAHLTLIAILYCTLRVSCSTVFARFEPGHRPKISKPVVDTKDVRLSLSKDTIRRSLSTFRNDRMPVARAGNGMLDMTGRAMVDEPHAPVRGMTLWVLVLLRASAI
jgi:hypothetical protein